MVELMS